MSSTVERLAAALAGRYRVERELGGGGMATVYLAHDLRHDRQVALKVLQPELAAALGSDRFLQEIRVTANLQHPHILALFDSGEADGFLFYVMPYVPGESLRGRLDREKQLPVTDAVRITTEIASALDYAHRQGVIHRDIKPENVLLHDGQAMVADFGIALAVQAAGGARLTATGLALGTPLYMSPEQAAGVRDVDARSDVYSLGVLLYEMLAGEPPHTGPTAQAVLASVVADEPRPVTAHRKTVPPRIAAAIGVALQKLPADRFPSTEAFAQALSGTTPWSGIVAAPGPAASGRAWLRDWRSWAVLGVAAVSILVAVLQRRTPATSPAPTARFNVLLPEEAARGESEVTSPAISADGTLLVYDAVIKDSSGAAHRQLLLRRLDQVEPVPIPGTQGGTAPFLSPGGRWVGFWLGNRLMKAPVTGGNPVILADSARPFFGTASWGSDGEIVFPIQSDALATVDQAGGTPRVIYRDSTMIVGQPMVLPGRNDIMFLRCRQDACGQRQQIAMVNPTSGAVTVLTPPGVFREVRYLPSHYLLYVRGDLFIHADADLVAAPFDLHKGLVGEAVPVVQHVQTFALSSTGTLVTVGVAAEGDELMIVAADGTARPLAEARRQYMYPALSPDGRRVAIEIHGAAGGQIWVYDTTSKVLTRLTSVGHNSRPTWSPDGSRIAFSSARDTASGIYVVPADGSAPATRVGIASTTIAFAEPYWSRDGRSIVYDAGNARRRTVYAVSPHADSVPHRVPDLLPPADRPVLSPDGRWLAYESIESGRPEVYVRPYPGPGGRWLVSADGGVWPVWAPSGHELFYDGTDGWLHAVDLVLGHGVQISRRRRLFNTGPYFAWAYDVFPDGKHFVFVRPASRPPEVHVTVNWFNELFRQLRESRHNR